MKLLQNLNNWFQNLKIKQKLAIIIIEMTVCMIFVGLVGFYISYQENQNILIQYENRLLSIKWLNSIWANIRENEANIYRIILIPDPAVKKQLAEDIENRGHIWLLELNNYSNIALHDAPEDKILPALQKKALNYIEVRNKAVELAVEGNKKEFFNAYFPFLPLVDDISNTLKNLSEYNAKMAEKEYAKSIQQSQISYIVIVVVIFTALGIAIFLGLLMVSSIINSIQTLVDKVKQVATGNLDVDPIEVKYKDEIGHLSELFNIMTDNLRRTTFKEKIAREREDFLRKEVDEQKRTFLSTLTHDLRSPILAEQKALEAIMSRAMGDSINDVEDFLQEIYRTNESLLRIVNNMLIADYYESETIELELEQKNIKEIIDNAIKSMNPLAKDNDSIIATDVQSGLPLVSVNSDEINRVIINLIGNAIKHNAKGTNIKVSAQKVDKGVLVSVADDGRGIPAIDRPNIFRKYPTTKRKVGSGLGLYLSKQIIDAHNGRIWFETKEDKGTTFYFILPVD